jgi:WD40 repeat protein
LARPPIISDKVRLLVRSCLRKGIFHSAFKFYAKYLDEIPESLPPPIQAASLISLNKFPVDKVYFIESEEHITYVYYTYENYQQIPLWLIKDGRFKEWQVITVDVPEGLNANFNACALSRNTKHFCVTVGNRVYVYLLSKTAAINSFKLVGHTHETISVAISHDSKFCASSEKGPSVRVNDLRTGIPLASLALPELTYINHLTFCYASDMLLGAGSDAKIHIWDIISAKELIHLNCSHTRITLVTMSIKKAYILACEDQRYLSLWSLKERAQIFLIKAHKENITSIGINDAEEFIFSTGYDGYLRLWDIIDGKCLAQAPLSCPIKSATVYMQNHILYCGGRNIIMRYYPLYRLKSGKLVVKDLMEKILPVEYEEQPNAESEMLKETIHNLIAKSAQEIITFQRKGWTKGTTLDSVTELMKYEDYSSLDMLTVFSAYNELLAAYFPKELMVSSTKFITTFLLCLGDELSITSAVLSKHQKNLVYGTSGGFIYILDTVTSKDELIKFSGADYKHGEIVSICMVQSDKLAACTAQHIVFLLEIDTARFLATKDLSFTFSLLMEEYRPNCIKYSEQLDLIIATGRTPNIVFIEPKIEPTLHILKIVYHFLLP